MSAYVETKPDVNASRAHDFGAVTAHEEHVAASEAGDGQRVEDPVEHGPAHDGHEGLGDVVRLRPEAAAPAGADHDGSHGLS